MRITTWNMRRAKAESTAWEQIRQLSPDIALLQEVSSIPDDIASGLHLTSAKVARKNGQKQTFSNVILSRFPLEPGMPLRSELPWVNSACEFFYGNIQTSRVKLSEGERLDLINVYSPAWPVPMQVIGESDVTTIRLQNNPQLWCTEILWKVLLDSWKSSGDSLIVAGDFNSSETFDYLWGNKPRGNREIIDRFNALGLQDALRLHHGHLVPTFRSARNGTVIHQMDHIYCTSQIIDRIKAAWVGSPDIIFGNGLSDHLPIMLELAP